MVLDLRHHSRRTLIGAAAGLLTSAAVTSLADAAQHPSKKPEKSAEEDVGAAEDLMREHGVLRRALLIYRQSAAQLRRQANGVVPDALNRTAKLFRTFGEDYHERQLEEAIIFPAVRQDNKQTASEAARLIDVLIAQHARGREITDYIDRVTTQGVPGDVEALARALDGFVTMYTNHAAREDTVLFPAWKEGLSERRYRELGERFEEIEHRQFGTDGFEQAVKQIAAIEQQLGYADLAQFTAPMPPPG